MTRGAKRGDKSKGRERGLRLERGKREQESGEGRGKRGGGEKARREGRGKGEG